MHTPALAILLAACAQARSPAANRSEAFAAATAEPLATSRDVLVIVLDDVGAGDLGACENIQTLASQGLYFSRAYSWPVCSSSRLAAMFGLIPRAVGLGDIVNTYNPGQSPSPYPPLALLSIAERLKPEGYRTSLIGKYHLGRPGDLAGEAWNVSTSAFMQGWDRVRAMSPDSIAFGMGTGYFNWDRVNDGARSLSPVYATDQQADEFIAWWQATPAPRLGWLAFSAAHAPYDTPPGYPPPGSTREAYEAVLDYADWRLASVLAAVDLDTTFVILFGDNGTPDDARPLDSPSGVWKGSTREGGVRVPLIVAGPGIAPGTNTQLVSLIDVPATICDLLDLPWPGTDSRSAFGAPRTWVFTERYHETLDDLAVIEASWKLRVVDGVEETYWLGGGGEEPLVPPQAVLTRLRAELASVPGRMQ